ncbi:hypothetical protein ACSBR2_026924 [Camellia fascicularis]
MTFPKPTIGKVVLKDRGMFVDEYMFWVCVVVLFGFSVLFNICFIAVPAFLNLLGDSKSIFVDEDDKSKKNKWPFSKKNKSSESAVLSLKEEVSTFPTIQRMKKLLHVLAIEQTDIHSLHVTVYEYIVYSSWLSLALDVNEETRKMFVEEVMELFALTPIRDFLIGLPGVNGF